MIKAVLVLWACLTTVSRAEEAVLRVSAASSLANVLKEINVLFEKSTQVKVELHLGASNALARQIEEGAPSDVFFSADLAKMEGLDKKGLIESKTTESQLSNTLVIVVPAASQIRMLSGQDLAGNGVKKIALGDPKAVPAGVYAKAWLEKLGLWEKLQSKIVATENVRAALAAVESGNVEAGIVYKTDAVISKKVKVAYEVPGAEGPLITYPMGMLKESRHPHEARRYLEFLDTKESKAIFEKHGFVVLPEPPAPLP